jgi:hypothetical protein
VIRQLSDIALQHPAVDYAIALPGLYNNGFTNSTNVGVVFVHLRPFEERTDPQLGGFAVANVLQQKFASIQGAFILIFPPPPVQGLGNVGGFQLQLEDRAGLGYEALHNATQELLKRAAKTPEIGNLFTGFTINVPQLTADRLTSEVVELCTRQNFLYWLANGQIFRGWARSALGNPVEGISWIEQGIRDIRATGTILALPAHLASKAEALYLARPRLRPTRCRGN